MTAEIAIANTSAVALAADSAVTIGRQKIYNSALKVFALSKVAPVGVMIYGGAALMNIPWETLIKLHRKELGAKKFDKLEGYADEFITFLKGSRKHYPKSEQEKWMAANIQGFFELIRDEIVDEVGEYIGHHGSIGDAETEKILLDAIQRRQEELGNRPHTGDVTTPKEASVRRKVSEIAKPIKNSVFQKLPLTRSAITQLYDIATYIHTRDVFSDNASGIVIAGFGEDDLFPVVRTYQIEGIYQDTLKYKYVSDKSCRINADSYCTIVPFAQDDMVVSFMQGINPSIYHFLTAYLHRVFERIPELLTESDLKGRLKKDRKYKHDQFARGVDKLRKDFFSAFSQHQQSDHVQPIMQMVHALPKDELAEMAESLVNLTAFKRRITQSLETVGGPIDVAVISKGDGLVWVKRKHYFPPELNQHFFANYFSDFR